MTEVAPRFKDGRSREARRWKAHLQAISARYRPTDALGHELTALGADLLLDYERLRAAEDGGKGQLSSIRKTVGLLLGTLSRLERLAAQNGDRPQPVAALDAIRAKLAAARQGGGS